MSCAIPPVQFPEWKGETRGKDVTVRIEVRMARSWRVFVTGIIVGGIGMWVVLLVVAEAWR